MTVGDWGRVVKLVTGESEVMMREPTAAISPTDVRMMIHVVLNSVC